MANELNKVTQIVTSRVPSLSSNVRLVMKIIRALTAPSVIPHILDYLGLWPNEGYEKPDCKMRLA